MATLHEQTPGQTAESARRFYYCIGFTLIVATHPLLVLAARSMWKGQAAVGLAGAGAMALGLLLSA